MHILLFTGKGGTGKTTLAAATAVAAASSGWQTLVVSTDGAHSLGDALAVPLGSQPVSVAPNLVAHEIDVQTQLDEKWSMMSAYLVDLLQWAGADRLRAEEMAVVPGLDELLALERLSEHAGEAWDLIVVDCAPTAETVRLLALPATIDHYLSRILPSHRRLARTLSPLVRGNNALPPSAPDSFVDSLLALADSINELHHTLTDPARATVRLVTTPDAMVVTETKRAWSLLTTFDHHVDSLVVNRLMPPDPRSDLVADIRRLQAEQVDEIATTFDSLHRYHVDLLPGGATGLAELEKLGSATYGPHGVLVPGAPSPATTGATFDHNQLTLPIHGAESADVRIRRSPRSIQVTLGSFRRIVDLPERFRHRRTTSAVVNADGLTLQFEEE